MKPSFTTYAHRQGVVYNETTHQYEPYVSPEQYVSRNQIVNGSNNKNLRPCSDYRCMYALYEWTNILSRYTEIDGQMVLTDKIDGPSTFVFCGEGLKTIQYGSLEEAQSKMFGQSLNLAMSAKDIIDANKMASQYFGRVAKAAPYLRKKQFGKALKAFFGTKSKSLAAANSWLEFQFGVLPTVHAVQDAYNHAALGIKAYGGKLLRLRSASKKLQVQQEVSPDSGWMQIPDYSVVTTYACYRYLSKEDFLQNMGRFNVVEVGWDATPWSFLIDWFVPVGDYLSQFGSITTFTTDGCDSVKTETKQHGTAVWLASDVSGHQTQSVHINEFEFNRTVNRTLSLNMTLSEMIQRSKLNLSCRRAASAFALARQRVGRK